MRTLLTLLTFSLTATALAGRDAGYIQNYNQYRDLLGRQPLTGGFGPLGNDYEYNMLRAQFGDGKFSVTFDDRLANNLAQNSPDRQTCPKVQRTKDLRTTLLVGVVIKGEANLLRLTREGKSGEYNVTDVWLYASKSGTVKGECSSGGNLTRYSLNLKQGWNVVRLYNNDLKATNIIQNLSSSPLPWVLR